QLARQCGNPLQPFVGSRLSQVGIAARHFAQYGNLRETGANIVMQVGGDAGAHALDLDGLGYAVAVRRENEAGQARERQSFKPPAPPDRWKNYEIDLRGRHAFLALRIHRLDQESIASRLQPGVVRLMVPARPLPVEVPALQLVLVAQALFRFVVEAHKLDLKLILRRLQIAVPDAGFTHLRD